jgi:hypothetical protein
MLRRSTLQSAKAVGQDPAAQKGAQLVDDEAGDGSVEGV